MGITASFNIAIIAIIAINFFIDVDANILNHMAPTRKRANTFRCLPSSRVELPDTDEEETETWLQDTVRHVASSTAPVHISRRVVKTTYNTTTQRQILAADAPDPSHPPSTFPSSSTFQPRATSTFRSDNVDDSDHSDPEIDPTGVGNDEDKGKRTKALLEWVPHQDMLLDELLRHDGIESDVSCDGCSSKIDNPLRCLDCWNEPVLCADCLRQSHMCNPFHRIELWTGSNWVKSSLIKQVGLTIQVGHAGSPCPANDDNTPVHDLTIIATNGVHKLRIKWCNCSRSVGLAHKHSVQLMRARLFPASYSSPQTAVTFECLKQFHCLTVQSKLTGFEFYQSIVHLTDNTGLDPPPKRYEEFMRVCRLWRHLKLLKRAGVGLSTGGVKCATLGSCALECPACPDPNISPRPSEVDEGVHPDSSDKEWLDSMYVMLDANFRLKSKDRNIQDDPSLGSGLAYYVEEGQYQQYLKDCPEQTEINYCDSGLHAIDQANTRGGDLYTASGVVACQCRHQLVQPNGVGDLQRGEKYANVDYIFWSTLRLALLGRKVKKIVVSYDIACQWHRNLMNRISNLPESFQSFMHNLFFTFVIPKFHITAHGLKCQSVYSLNLRRFMGRTDGENIERGWAWMNPASLSTREMGPGGRRDTLDDQWAAWNWRQITVLGVTLLRKFYTAVAEAREKRAELFEFTGTFEKETIARWEAMLRAWQNDPYKAYNPFDEPTPTTTLNDVRKQLNAEEDALLKNGNLPVHETSATQFLILAIGLEDSQRILRDLRKSLGRSKADSRHATIDEKDRALRRRIMLWKVLQRIYMPYLDLWRASTSGVSSNTSVDLENLHAELLPIELPSSLPDVLLKSPQVKDLANKELRLRSAQCYETLTNLRRELRIGAFLYDHKKVHVAGTGQRRNTRMLSFMQSHTTKQLRDADRYRHARRALSRLDPGGSWQSTLLPLHPDDVVPPFRGQEDKVKKRKRNGTKGKTPNPSEGYRTLSWIWKTVPQRNGDVEVDPVTAEEAEEGLRVEWCKLKSRTERWEEEVLLLREEMRRVIVSLDYRAKQWRLKARARSVDDQLLASGLIAYGEKQALLYNGMATDFASIWLQGIEDAHLPAPKTWPVAYLTAKSADKQVIRRLSRVKARLRVICADVHHLTGAGDIDDEGASDLESRGPYAEGAQSGPSSMVTQLYHYSTGDTLAFQH